MKRRLYRLEVGRTKSPMWGWFIRKAKLMPSYKVISEDGLELHCIETRSISNLSALFEHISGWKGWAFYIDSRPTTRNELHSIVWEWRREHDRSPLAKYAREITGETLDLDKIDDEDAREDEGPGKHGF